MKAMSAKTRNILRMSDGSYFDGNLSKDDAGSPVIRVHSDASYNANREEGHQGGYVGMAFCIELADDAADDVTPVYAYATDSRPINYSSTVAELRGIVFALSRLKMHNIEIICDNTDAVNVSNYIFHGGKASDFDVNDELMREIVNLERFKHRNIVARWERGHGANPYNHAVNRLARLARRMKERDRNQVYAEYKIREMKREFIKMRSGDHYLVRSA
jgi:ribonuclease HI